MIVKSDIGNLPETLRPQFANGVERKHPLWRIANQGLTLQDLNKRIEFYACMALTGAPERAFKLTLADTDPLASRINELASGHKLAKSRVFEILVKIGWESLQAYANQIGAAPAQPQAPAAVPPASPTPVTKPSVATPTVVTAQEVAVAASQPAKPAEEQDFADTPEFVAICNNMLAQFGIDFNAPSEDEKKKDPVEQ